MQKILQIILLSLTFGVFGVLTWASSDDEIREAIDTIISQRHPTDNADTWKQLGSNAPQVIISMYKDESSTYKRIRMIDGLAWFDHPAAIDFLKNLADSNVNSVIQIAAIRAVAISQGLKEGDFLSKAMQHKDPSIRSEIAKSLMNLKKSNLDRLIDIQLREEKDPLVLSSLTQHRKTMQRPPLLINRSTSSLH